MKLDPIALAVPVFFLLIGLELLVARARRRRVYRFTDSFADLGCGVTQRVVLLLFEASLLAVYALLYEHGRLWTFAPGSAWPCFRSSLSRFSVCATHWYGRAASIPGGVETFS